MADRGADTHPVAARGPRPHLVQLGLLFLKLGTIGFGRPAAHIALILDEVVGRRRWMSEQRFQDLDRATN